MLLYFLLGIVFIYIFIPIIDGFLSIFSTWTEYVNYKMVAKVMEIKKKYNIEGESEEAEEASNPIGFVCTEAIGIEEPELPELDPEQEQEEDD